jgi:hypothetical protein
MWIEDSTDLKNLVQIIGKAAAKHNICCTFED